LISTPLVGLRHKSRCVDYLDCTLDLRSVRCSAFEIGVASAKRNGQKPLAASDRVQIRA
jgi:hypothetical protein